MAVAIGGRRIVAASVCPRPRWRPGWGSIGVPVGVIGVVPISIPVVVVATTVLRLEKSWAARGATQANSSPTLGPNML